MLSRIAALLVFLAAALQAGAQEETSRVERSIVGSSTALREIGVHVRRVRHQTPGASVAIDVKIDTPARELGKHLRTECVVLVEEVAPEALLEIDARLDDAGVVARRSQSLDSKTSFLVLGKEAPRAYLVFEFTYAEETSPPGIVKRVLFPVTSPRTSG